MDLRFAFVGFRHGHVFDLLARVRAGPGTAVAAACEEDRATREALAQRDDVTVTHDRFDRMLEEVECDVVAVGDTYGRRGAIVARALEAGRHVISDKPLCCRVEELERIRAAAQRGRRVVGCQLDLRSDGALRALRSLVAEGRIGEVHTVTFHGQHPLSLGRRPAWYFEPGQHGGTINDLAVHGIDAIRWITGREFAEVSAARAWNARAPQYPEFQDAAQMMLKLDNGGGVIGDVSYLAPDGCGYAMPDYWRFTLHGSEGFAEATFHGSQAAFATHADKAVRFEPAHPSAPGAYFTDFLAEVHGGEAELRTRDVLAASQVCLTAQRAAEQGGRDVPCAPAV